MQSDLIYDIGCNNGDDTDFYLRKGFKVVAVDADHSLCQQVAQRFSSEVAEGRLKVVHGLIGDGSSGMAAFYLFDECSGWNTADPEFKARLEAAGHVARKVEMPVVTVADLMREHGVPYYMKVDIEGHDLVAVQGLQKLVEQARDKPSYLSIEFSREDLGIALEQLVGMKRCGYTRFQFVNQGMRRSWRAPQPPLEGRFAEFQPEQITTGLFGRELDGKWLDEFQATERIADICHWNELFRSDPRFSKNGRFSGTWRAKLVNRYRRHVLKDPINGLELHAN
jgi:FkbM family methyltransferase